MSYPVGTNEARLHYYASLKLTDLEISNVYAAVPCSTCGVKRRKPCRTKSSRELCRKPHKSRYRDFLKARFLA